MCLVRSTSCVSTRLVHLQRKVSTPSGFVLYVLIQVNKHLIKKKKSLYKKSINSYYKNQLKTAKNKVKFAPLQKEPNHLYDDQEILLSNPRKLPSVLRESKKTRSQLLMEVLGCCHSITTVNNMMIGDPLDLFAHVPEQYSHHKNDLAQSIFPNLAD